jgi:hypothetical protein
MDSSKNRVYNICNYLQKENIQYDSLDHLYTILLKTNMFKCLLSLGFLEVSYDKRTFKEFTLSKGDHSLLIALAYFLNCAMDNSVKYKAIVSVPFLNGNDLTINFERLTPTIIVGNINCIVIRFRSNPGIGSQFLQSDYYDISRFD